MGNAFFRRNNIIFREMYIDPNTHRYSLRIYITVSPDTQGVHPL